jgi:ABC-type antimicrobial peptide transport system permease subunit
MGLDDSVLEGVKILQLRVRDGDDASCFNLNRAQTPRLLGVQPTRMQERGAFKLVETIKDNKQADRWKLLDNNYGEDVVPAIGDYATIIWALGRSIGDELEYTDDEGQKFRLRLVGILKNSILQGTLIVSEDQFIKRFPSESGYRMFLIDAPQDKTGVVTEKLSTALRDYGLELTDAKQRLAEFSAIENTYLSVFAALGGLGLILGSMGLGVLVLRNILERRGELAMLQAVGFRKSGLKQLVFYEHWFLVLGGLTCGIAAALVAIAPVIKSLAAQIPYFSLTLTIIAIAVSGVIWIWMATVFALGGKMLEALRNE